MVESTAPTALDPGDEFADEFLEIGIDDVVDAGSRPELAQGSAVLEQEALQRALDVEAALRAYLAADRGRPVAPQPGRSRYPGPFVRTDDRRGPRRR